MKNRKTNNGYLSCQKLEVFKKNSYMTGLNNHQRQPYPMHNLAIRTLIPNLDRNKLEVPKRDWKSPALKNASQTYSLFLK